MNGLYVAASGAASMLADLESAAGNLANASTPGFRRLFTQVQAMGGNGSPYRYAVSGGVPMVDTAQGPLHRTGNPLDVGLTGAGFMTVQTPNGYAYTRDGELSVDSRGTLMAAGYPLVAVGGGTITVAPGNLTISPDGLVSLNGDALSQIALADPTGAEMQPVGQSLYRPAGGGALPADATGTQLHQGFLESSTGSLVGSMLGVMNAMRSYQASMNAVHSISNDEQHAIQTLTLQA